MSCWLSYWRLTVPAKSETEIEAEKWLLLIAKRFNQFFVLHWIRFNRWHLVVVAFLNLFCVGSIFSMDFLDDTISGFFLDKAANSALSCQLVGMVTMGFAAALSGPFIESRGPRVSMAIATGLVVLGWICALFSVMFRVYPLLNIGFGVLVSAGYGITMLVSVATAQKWFPDLRGIVSGICIAGMSGGSLVWLPIYAALLHRKSNNIFVRVSPELDNAGLRHIFLLHGGVALVVMFLAMMIFRTPPPNYAVNGTDIHCVPLNKAPPAAHVQNNYLNVGMTLVNFDAVVNNQALMTDCVYFSHVKALSLVQCIFSSDFFFLYVAIAASIAPSVLFSFEMSEFVTALRGETISQGNILLVYISIASVLGCLVGPLLADVIIRVFYANPAYVRKMVFTALLLSQTIGLACLVNSVGKTTSSKWPLYIVSFSSGGGFGLTPSFLADLFGLYNAGTMYGFILTKWSFGALIFGFKQRQLPDVAHHISAQLQSVVILGIVGCIVMVLVRSSSMDRFYRGYQLTMCGKIIIQLPSRHLMMEMKTSEHARTLHGLGDISLSDNNSPILLVDPDYLQTLR
ncbi:unnamed protein product [Aphanomyces euteiches]|uniref:Major facilitator superfamily (MFS) profile domain-containing protein n=1 Tax=Aphanomyces euteiches TaxID=100861 RepID=A0A6G0WQG0_9STRA|nr:hypothetical protein Ae201684_012739 [Aphanomyces euteiches]KAH9095668.1 hypothetical protein Ae201684P_015467 [Aphanomyces euteiches]